MDEVARMKRETEEMQSRVSHEAIDSARGAGAK